MLPLSKSKTYHCGVKMYAKFLTMKLCTIVETFIIEEQNLLKPGRSCIDFVITRNQLGDQEFNIPTFMDFIGVEKAFWQSQSTETMWKVQRFSTSHQSDPQSLRG